MGRRELARGIPAVCLGVWAVSFFLPAFDSYYWSENHHVSGFGAVGYSILMGIGGVAMLAMSSPRDVGHFAAVPVTLMIGTLWMANVLMVMAPFCFSRMEREVATGGMFAGLLSLFSAELCVLFEAARRGDPSFSWGRYVWAVSIFCTAGLLLALRLTNAAEVARPHPLHVSAEK